MWDQTCTGPEDRRKKLNREVSLMPVFSTPVKICLLPNMQRWSLDWGREDWSPVYLWFYTFCRHHPEVPSCRLYNSVLGHEWRIILTGQSFRWHTWLDISFGRRKDTMCETCDGSLISGLWPTERLEGKRFAKSMIGKLTTKTSGEEYMDRSLQMNSGCEDTLVPCTCSPKSEFSCGGVQ